MVQGIQNKKLSTDGNELQVNIGSGQHIYSPKYLIGAFQTEARIGTSNEKKRNRNFR